MSCLSVKLRKLRFLSDFEKPRKTDTVMPWGVKTFRKKPVEVQALQWSGEMDLQMADFLGDLPQCTVGPDGTLHIFTLEGTMKASEGDWIIKGVKGEFYPCKPDIFRATYEEV